MEKEITEDFDRLVNSFSMLDQVEAILLGGSRSVNTSDSGSDYDLYVYLSAGLPVEKRKEITDRYCSYMELNSTFWETEDDGILNNGIPIDIIYRGLDWVNGHLEGLLFRHEASTGYSTAIWYNYQNSQILFDRNGRALELQKKFSIPYPQELKKAIIRKNHPLLRAMIPGFLHQIEKALKRNDLVSVNHRIAAFFGSYFDIIFAMNELPHPGEKRILQYLDNHARHLPDSMIQEIQTILTLNPAQSSSTLLRNLETLTDHLDQKLKDLDFFPEISYSPEKFIPVLRGYAGKESGER